jgi:hypothetical protein
MTTTDDHRAAALRPMPTTHGDLTAEWLTAALRSGGVDATVSGFERKPLGERVGMMAALERIELTYGEGDGPASIIVKLPATNEANRAVALAFDIYRREVHFYRELVALWHQTLVDRGVTGYSAEQAWETTAAPCCACGRWWSSSPGTLDTSNERGKAWMTEMVRRSAAAIEDLDLLTLLPEFE